MSEKVNSLSNPPQTLAARSLSVLIVEDSTSQALRLKLMLENHGCQVHWSNTGFSGLATARQTLFDLIILDVELPDINGFEVCKRLKANPLLLPVPVVMLTTLDEAEYVMSGLEVGAIDYIPKDTFAEMVLLETIRQMREGPGPRRES
jgi:DNA-binding response OmpR family regulator